jgi:hypothetical protein
MPFDSLPEITTPVIVDDEVTIILRTARDIVQRGWCRGELHHNNHQEHCTLGAIRQANGWKVNALYRKAVKRFSDDINLTKEQRILHTPHKIVMSWNDVPFRTKGQILAKFTRVISKK